MARDGNYRLHVRINDLSDRVSKVEAAKTCKDIRDEFAMSALIAFLGNPNIQHNSDKSRFAGNHYDIKFCVKRSYEIADAMMEARKK